MSNNNKYVALLRGINVGGHHKVPMAELKATLSTLGYSEISTLLNSGNVLFEAPAEENDIAQIEDKIATQLEHDFGFAIPTIVVAQEKIKELIALDPFSDVTINKDIRLYISFLKHDMDNPITLPWSNEEKSFHILAKRERILISVLDLSISKTPKAMEALEKFYSKNCTTRNWNTILKIGDKAH